MAIPFDDLQPDRVDKNADWNWTTPNFLRNGIQIATVNDVAAVLPSQGGHAGQFLTTNGVSPLWQSVSGGDLVSATLATASGAIANTINNSAGVTFDIPILGADATQHSWEFKIGGTSGLKITTVGNGAGGVDNGEVIVDYNFVVDGGNQIFMQDPSFIQPFGTQIPFAHTYGIIGEENTIDGGLVTVGITSNANTNALFLGGLNGTLLPNVPCVLIAGGKSDGAGSIAPVGNTEVLLEVSNAAAIPLLDVYGNGDTIVVGNLTAANLSGTNTGDQTLNSLLPSQGGHAGEFLSTNGSNTSWIPGAGGGTITGGGAAGQVSFWTGATAISGDNGLYWDNVTKQLGLGTTTPNNILDIVKNQNNATGVSISNTTAGVNATAVLGVVSDVNQGFFGATSSVHAVPYLAGNIGISGFFNSLIFAADVAAGGGGSIKFNVGGDTAAEQKMIILANGNVGIGNPTPGFKLDVAGGGEFVDLAGNNDLVLYAGAASIFHIVSNIAPQATWIQSVGDNTFGQATADLLFRNTATGNNIVFTEFGSVGIGTTTPLHPLHVVGGIFGTLELRLAGTLVLSGSGPDEGVLSFDKSLEKFVISENTGPFVPLLTTSSVTLQQAYLGGQTIGENTGGIVITRGSGSDALPLLEVDNYFGGSVQNAIRVGSNQGAIPLESFVANLSNSDAPTAFTLRHIVSGAPAGANGIGVAQIFDLPSDDGTQRGAAKITGGLSDVTTTLEDGYLKFAVMRAGALTDILTIEQDAVTITTGQVSKTVGTAISYTVLPTDYYVGVTSTAAPRTITLPATGVVGQTFIIKDESGAASVNNITIDGNGNNVDGAATYIINIDYGSATVIFRNGIYQTISN